MRIGINTRSKIVASIITFIIPVRVGGGRGRIFYIASANRKQINEISKVFIHLKPHYMTNETI